MNPEKFNFHGAVRRMYKYAYKKKKTISIATATDRRPTKFLNR